MESPPHATETQPAGAYAAHKCSNGKENDEAPSLAERVRDALRRQPLTDRGAARDAVEPPQRECFELSDGERAELHTYLATGAAAQPPALKVAQDPSDRKRRADAFADAPGTGHTRTRGRGRPIPAMLADQQAAGRAAAGAARAVPARGSRPLVRMSGTTWAF